MKKLGQNRIRGQAIEMFYGMGGVISRHFKIPFRVGSGAGAGSDTGTP